jgi:hypothetical protein
MKMKYMHLVWQKASAGMEARTWKSWLPTDTTTDDTHGDNHAMWIDEENPDR